eukprot:CAMPEP_0204520524 /NCGR_PEP_ID=MMETSP0661-20131031/5310_1 /ASSEMBLY_ACC=CAM_ASM_000606 /TAXON_ID=109239 /ORGANISM="Alexandrium margalefi, Strain AMGDE01CS-322" /LENGTH=87 /DNA_ID=CAMNT_0051526087 /DNA_START=28 /DNA_END=287 /DNA_ORIENTATION=+
MPLSDGGSSDSASQCSRSSAGCSMSSLMSGSATQFNRFERMRATERARHAGPAGDPNSLGDLFSRLEAAEKNLQANSIAVVSRSSDT